MADDDQRADEADSVFRQAFDWMFRSRETGRIIIFQFPNVALWIFFVTAVIRRFAGLEGPSQTALEVVAFVSLMWWAVDEIVRGVNPFRRALGTVVAATTVIGLFWY